MSALYGGRQGKRAPAGNPTSIICHGLMDAAAVGFPEAHQNASAMATLALTGYEVPGFDTVMPAVSFQQEAEALGCIVHWGHRDMMPSVKVSPCKEFKNVIILHSLLENLKAIAEAVQASEQWITITTEALKHKLDAEEEICL
jgi:uroporphyrinogen-III decarboxylase